MTRKLWGRLHEREDGSYRAVRIGSLASADASWNWRVTDIFVDDALASATQAKASASAEPRKPLPVEAIHRLWDEHFKLPLLSAPIRTSPVEKFARAIEVAHNITPKD